MEIFSISKEEYQKIITKLDNITEILNRKNRANPIEETWLDILEVYHQLKISTKTL